MLFLPLTYEQKFSAEQATDSFFVRMDDVLSALLVFLGAAIIGLVPRGFAIVNTLSSSWYGWGSRGESDDMAGEFHREWRRQPSPTEAERRASAHVQAGAQAHTRESALPNEQRARYVNEQREPPEQGPALHDGGTQRTTFCRSSTEERLLSAIPALVSDLYG
jgi:hypothetical protein